MLASSGGGLILYQAYGNLYAMTGRKAHFLEDKQIPSVGVLDEVFSIWKAFGGNTRDLGSFGEETHKTTDLHQHFKRLCSQRLETASQDARDTVTNSSYDGVTRKHDGVSSYLAFGRHLEEIRVTWAHLEKKRTRLQTYTNISQDYVPRGWRRHHKMDVTSSQDARDAVTIHPMPATRNHDGVSSHDPAQDLEYSTSRRRHD
ncbi:hypothetical protein Tco_0820310 [Tanacetum coccineum]|uniref:Uncharacterized protein n=1 Tax=Tanacetum coccineum TaxID=301880 RepID=A0ABQ5A9X8_9ASTR